MLTTGIIINLLVTALAVVITAYVLPGVALSGFIPALGVAILLALLNTFIRPVLLLLTLPINIVTIGLFTLVINALIIIVISNLIDGFRVDGFWWALLFSIILSIVNAILSTVI